MFIYKVDIPFTDKMTGIIYLKRHLYFSDDEARAEELASTENDRETVLIHKLTKKELVGLAEQHNVDIDKKAKVDELHETLYKAKTAEMVVF